MDRNILMLCYYYPPLTDVGCKRSVAFSRYLRKHGWNPYVLSVKNPDRTYCSLGKDAPPQGVHTEYSYSLINLYRFFGKLNGALSRMLGLMNIRLERNPFYDMFCIPDFFLGWIPLTTIKALKLIKIFKIDILYVSCTPFSSALIGALLKLLTGKPLVLDFRDPFALKNVSSLNKEPNFRTRINLFIEEKLLRYADIFIVTTEEIRKGYVRQYPAIKDHIFTVHNGFESEYAVRSKTGKYSKFTIVYTGDFYFHALESRLFFEALALLKSRGEIDASNFQFLFYGEGRELIRKIAADFGIEDIVMTNPRIPYRDALDAISRSHLQLLRIFKPMISTKLFEGIPLNTPFLATIEPGEVEEIIRKYSPSSYVVTQGSAEEIAWAILDATAKYGDNAILDNYVREFLEKYSREKLTLKLIDIIDKNLYHEGALLEKTFENS